MVEWQAGASVGDGFGAAGSSPAYDRPVILRCTKKLLTVMGVPVAEPAPMPTRLAHR